MQTNPEEPMPARPRPFRLSKFADAYPAFLLAAAYAVTGLGRVSILGFDGRMLADLLRVEFFAVIFGMAILTVISGRSRGQILSKTRYVRALLVIAVIALAVSLAAGPWGPLLLLLATWGTYWSPWKRWYSEEGISNSVMRGIITLVLYGFWVLLAYRPPEWALLWHDVRHTHIGGFFYFMCLGVLEWSGDMDR